MANDILEDIEDGDLGPKGLCESSCKMESSDGRGREIGSHYYFVRQFARLYLSWHSVNTTNQQRWGM